MLPMAHLVTEQCTTTTHFRKENNKRRWYQRMDPAALSRNAILSVINIISVVSVAVMA